jgi:hypothetical protein
VVQGCTPKIRHRFELIGIPDDIILLLLNLLLRLKIALNQTSCIIIGGIINDHNMVVLVILHNDRFHILEIPTLGCVVVGRHNDAERQLLIFVYVVFLLVVLLLFGSDFVEDEIVLVNKILSLTGF